MTTEKTFVQLLAEDMGEKNVPAIVVEKLEAGGYDSVQVLQENPTTKDEFLAMEVPMLWAKKLAAKYGPQESPAPALMTTPAPTTDLDALIVDQKVAEFSWARIKTLPRSMVASLVKDFFADTTSTTSTGYRFMEAMRSNTGRPVIAKVRGQVNQNATEELVWRLIQGTAVINGDIFELSPTEKFVVCDLSEVNTKTLKRDVMSPTGGTLPEGAVKNSYGVTLYDVEGNCVLPEAVQQFLALALTKNEINDQLMRQMARDWRGREAEVTVEELQYDFPKTWEEVTVRGVEQYPPLEVKEGENRPFFSNSNTAAVTVATQMRFSNVFENLAHGDTLNITVDGKPASLRVEKPAGAYNPQYVEVVLSDGSSTRLTSKDTAEEMTEMVQRALRRFGIQTNPEVWLTGLCDAIEMAKKSSEGGLPSGQIINSFLATSFDKSELRTLCFGLSVEYDDLPADNLSGKRQELIKYMDRRGRTSELVNKIKDMRPGAPWDYYR